MQQQGNSANDLGRNQIGQNAPNKSSRANVVPVNNKNKKTILKKYIIIAASIFAVACLLVFSPYLFNSFKGQENRQEATKDEPPVKSQEEIKHTFQDGVLTIIGNGPMKNFSTEEDPGKKWGIDESLIKSVVIEDGITSIGDYAFTDCSSLTSISIPDSVTSIGQEAFGYCSSLASITIPDGATSIGAWAFCECTSLANISIPDSVTSINEYAFAGCISLAVISIPDSVTSIESFVFGDCYSLTDISIPDGVTSIGDGSFCGCTGLAGISIPDGVTSIGSAAFASCTSLASISIPYGVTSIGDWTFYDCTSLTSISIPDSVTSIGTQAFAGCTSLTSISIPDSVISIGTQAFSACTGLTSISIPDSVTSIGDGAFAGCTSLPNTSIPNGVSDANDGEVLDQQEDQATVAPSTLEEIMKVLVQGTLDYQYLGQWDDTFLNLLSVTPDVLQEIYDDSIQADVDDFMQRFQIDYPTQEMKDRVGKIFKEIYSHADYTVKEVTLLDDGSYAVLVMSRPIDIMLQAAELFYEASTAINEKYADADFNNMSNEEYMAYDHDWAEAAIDLVESLLPNLGYEDEETVVIHVTQNEEGAWGINPDDFKKVNIIYYP